MNMDEKPTNHQESKRLIRLNQVLEIVPVSRSTIWQWAKDGRFPAPIKIGERTTAWRYCDVVAFIESR